MIPLKEKSSPEIAASSRPKVGTPRNDVFPVKSFLDRHKRKVEILALGGFLSGIGVLVSLVLSRQDNQGIEIVNSNNAGIDETGQDELLADVAGAVINPGVYRLPAGSRFADAMAAAGGLAAAADRNWVSRHLNLAQNITDGIKIYIPAKGEGNTSTTGITSTTGGEIITDTININSASLDELDTLWGVGESRAKAVVAGRPYGNVEELVTRKVLPKNVVERNRDKLRL